jgi:hypothetical protein
MYQRNSAPFFSHHSLCLQGFCPDYAYLDSNRTQKYFGYFMPQFRSLTISRAQTLPKGHCILSHTPVDSLKAYGYDLHVIPGHFYSMELRHLRLRTHDASVYIYRQN